MIFRPSYGPAFPNVKHWWGHNLFAYSRSKTTFPYMPNVPSLLGKNLIAKIVSLGLVSMYVWQNVRAAGTYEGTSEFVLIMFWQISSTYILIIDSSKLVPIKIFDIPAALSVPSPSVCPFLHQAYVPRVQSNKGNTDIIYSLHIKYCCHMPFGSTNR